MRRQALLLDLPLTLRRSSLGGLDHEWPFASTAMAFPSGQCTRRSSIPHQLVVSVATNKDLPKLLPDSTKIILLEAKQPGSQNQSYANSRRQEP